MKRLTFKRSLFAIICLIAGVISTHSQSQPEIYATSNGHTFKLTDLSTETQAAVSMFPKYLAQERSAMLAEMINDEILSAEARSRGTDVQKLIATVTAKVAAPTEDAIRSVYTANIAALGGKPLDEVRNTIVEYLRHEADNKAVQAFVDSVKAKHRFAAGRDINDASLGPADRIFSVGDKVFTAADFEKRFALRLYEAHADIADTVMDDLRSVIFSTLVTDEARALDIDSSTLMSREVTGKITDFADGELERLQDEFRDKLFAKYQVKILYQEPEPVAQNISVDDDPSTGPADAPVTVIMFSDFQCPACSATHPLLKRAISHFPGKVRLVVRDFPLTNIHKNAFNAALAANAVMQSGKFFDYIEILYKHQDALDPASLKRYAVEIGVSPTEFDSVFASPAADAEVRKDIEDGESYGVNSTPTIFVNGVEVRRLSESGIRRAIQRALAK